MKLLGLRNYELLNRAIGYGDGYFEGYWLIEEELYTNQADELLEFCKWLEEARIDQFTNPRSFGISNYEERFKEFKSEKQ